MKQSKQSHAKPICTYCGEREGRTKDHIPPKGLFSKPRPSLVTVPCCEECRQLQQLDDEYFLRMVSMRSGITETPSAKAARDSVHRSLLMPSKARFTRALLRSTKDVQVQSQSGIYLGTRMSYDVDLGRLSNVIRRTTCGLYLHEFGRRLADDHRCKAYAIDGFEKADSDSIAALQRLWEHAVSGTRRDFSVNVFSYWVRKIDGPEGATNWAFLVYGQISFLAFTGPKTIDMPVS